MMKRIVWITLIASLVPLAGHTFAQSDTTARPGEASPPAESTPVTLHGRHSIGVGIGLLSNTRVAPGDVRTSGFMGSLSYTHWPHAEWGLELSVSLLDTEAALGRTASVTSFLIGMAFYPESLALGPSLRPYVMGAVGSYVGSEANGWLMDTEARTEAVVGARLGAGLDVYPGRWIRLGVRGAYHAMPEFSEALGTIRSAKGAQFSFEMGVQFGGR